MKNGGKCFLLTGASTILILASYTTFVDGNINKQVAGPYDIIIQRIEHCPNEGTKEFLYDVKLKKINRTALVANVTAWSKHPIDDDMLVTANVALFTNGGWKENFYTYDVGGVCRGVHILIPKFAREVFKSAGVKDCPLKPGNYTLQNLLLDVEIPVIPVFFYNKYRLEGILRKRTKRIGCFRVTGDVVPKKIRNSG